MSHARRRAFRPMLGPVEIRIAPSSLAVSVAVADDPLPDPQPDPGTHSGSNPPPTSGPIGPGTL